MGTVESSESDAAIPTNTSPTWIRIISKAMDFKIVAPLRDEEWDLLLAEFPKACFFHSSAWCRTLKETYDYRPFYIVVHDAGEVIALVSLMEVDSWLTGCRGVHLPFADNCPVLLKESGDWPEIWDKLKAFGNGRRWKYLELRGDGTDLFPSAKRTGYINHVVDLDRETEKLVGGLRDSNRRNIRKALKMGVVVKREDSYDALQEFYRLHVITRKRHGLPPQPARFFEALYRNVLKRGNGYLFLAYRTKTENVTGKSIAGAVFLTFENKAIYKYGASETDADRSRPNNIVMWTAMEMLQSEGFKTLDMGRTQLLNEGLRRFKAGWGASEDVISYWKYSFKERTFVDASLKISGWHNRVFSKMPLPLLKVTSRLLYRHMG